MARNAMSPQGQPGENYAGHPDGPAHHTPAHYPPAYYAPPSNAYTVQARSPILYCLIDFLVTGLGLMLQGRALLGATFLIVTVVCFPLSLIPFVGWLLIPLVILPIGVISMILAFTTAASWNRRHGIIT